MRPFDRMSAWWVRTAPVDPAMAAALRRRWRELPDVVRTENQLVGRHAVGCEGTHGVFPRCNLTCKPCYHSADANKVRVDGPHTVDQVEAQMAWLQAHRAPHGHAQLIGGEVTLLDPDDHAAALLAMRAHGREPMSMTHGDVDADYLRRLVLDDEGEVRLPRVSFAAHMDSLMRGRRGIPRPRDERALEPYRRRFLELVRGLRRDHGVRSYVAHNMTVTPANVGQVAEVVRTTVPMGYDMLSFQPAAYVGDERRWVEDFRSIDPDAVWAEIERGAGGPLPWRALQMGDPRCNRSAWGWLVADRFVPLLDEDDPRDLAFRDQVLRRAGGVRVSGTPPLVLLVRLARVAVGNLGALPAAVGWVRRSVRRSGGALHLLRHARSVRPMTFVMHMFMDAAQVRPAWELMERNEVATDPEVRATQERLRSCVYAMAHPEQGRVVPACVQHSVLDPAENRGLRRLLPLVEVRSG
ncbi:radical SAM domain-containing protein [Nocardioides coralli]|uniref:radical SAM domain-containing protein n=1 Tax=Nocardioides coralli TaxID=2872154 RepID=UPI001CA41FC3|nr:radical SAM domain-containing protein [Nocardioides coralli]QZY30124.1 radical SAM domain-containing protein [Nocardioides coralli]